MYHEDDKSSGRLTICQHLICGECQSEYEDDLDHSLQVGRAECPECGFRGDRQSFIVRPGAGSAEHKRSETDPYSTKLLGLLRNVKAQVMNSAPSDPHPHLNYTASCFPSGKPLWTTLRLCSMRTQYLTIAFTDR